LGCHRREPGNEVVPNTAAGKKNTHNVNAELTEKVSVLRQSVLILGIMECFIAEYSIIFAKLGIIVKANSYNNKKKIKMLAILQYYRMARV
jgi:hypothetical protein